MTKVDGWLDECGNGCTHGWIPHCQTKTTIQAKLTYNHFMTKTNPRDKFISWKLAQHPREHDKNKK